MSKKALYKHKKTGDLFAIETDEGWAFRLIIVDPSTTLPSAALGTGPAAHLWHKLAMKVV